MRQTYLANVGRIAGFLCALLAGSSALAESVADFYRSKTVTLYVYGEAGGSTDFFGRILSRRIGHYLPGEPTIIVKNIAGAGGITLMNFAYNVGPQDGSAFYAPLGASDPLAQLLNPKGIKYDAGKLHWLGSIEDSVGVLYTSQKSPTKTMADATKRETPMAATGKTSNVYQLPTLSNALLGTKFKVVLGYPSGAKMELAVENGEVDGRYAIFQTLQATRPAWIKQKQINILAQSSIQRSSDLPDTPTLIELAKAADDKSIFELMAFQNVLGRPFFAPQGVPADRVKALREAFMAVMKDSTVIADIEKMGVKLHITGGDEVQNAVTRMIQTPPQILGRTRSLLGLN